MSLEQKDLELIERIVYKHNDDVAVSIARSFERLEERIDAAESRIYSRLADLDTTIESARQDISDNIGDVKDVIRDMNKMREEIEAD